MGNGYIPDFLGVKEGKLGGRHHLLRSLDTEPAGQCSQALKITCNAVDVHEPAYQWNSQASKMACQCINLQNQLANASTFKTSSPTSNPPVRHTRTNIYTPCAFTYALFLSLDSPRHSTCFPCMFDVPLYDEGKS